MATLGNTTTNQLTVNGTINVIPKTGNYTEGIRIHKYSGWGTFVLGCNTGTTSGSQSTNGGWAFFNNTSNQLVISNVDSGTANASIWINTNKAVTMAGTLTAANVYNAVYNDYAEFFPRGEETEPGDVIALDINSDEEKYIKSNIHLRHHVVGVHSDDYAMIIGGDKDVEMRDNEVKYIPVSLMGRVKVKYIGAAKKGNYVVASEVTGVARAYDKDKDSELDIFGFLLEEDDKTDEVRRLKIKLKG